MRLVLILLFFCGTMFAQSGLDTSYEPNASYPYGRMNPKAPAELKQFSFMIGDFDCTDEIFNPATKKWNKMPAIWNAKYFLNGQAIQDQYWSPAFSTSNIRMFDTKSKSWKVTFYKMPGHTPTPAWEGKKVGEKLIMRKGDEKNGSRLTFHSITEDGFSWKGENLSDGVATKFWTSICKRRR